MSYFSSAEEAARALELTLLMRAELDPRVLERHDRLSALAAPTPQAGRFYHRLAASLATAGGAITPAAGGVLWVTGPSGALEHLPWAVGLADHLARAGAIVGLADRSGAGPLASLAAEVRRSRVSAAAAEWILGGPVSAIQTDLSGVRILQRSAGPETAGAPTGVVSWLILADALPESLEGPYPSAEGLDATVLVAAFRDHSRFELESVVRGLRAAGHRLAGLIALGPSLVEEPAGAIELPRWRGVELAGATPPSAAPALPEPVSERIFEPPELEPAMSPSPAPASEPDREVEAPAQASSPPEPVPAPPETAAPPRAPEPPREPVPTPVASSAATSPPAPAASATPAPAPASGPPIVPLLTTWDRQVRKDRRRRRHGGVLIALVLTAALLGAIYVLFLRPVGVRLPAGLLRGASGERGGAPAPEPAAIDADSASAPLATPPTSGAPAATEADSARQLFGTPAPADSLASAAPVAPAESAAVTPSDRAAIAESLRAVEASASRDSAAAGLTAARPPAATPDSLAAARPGAPAPIVDTTSARAPQADTTRPGSAGGPFVIHLSSFKLEEEAGREVERAAAQGLVARAVLVEVPERGTWYRIVTGEFATFAQAESAAHALQARGLIPYAHIAGDGGRGNPIPVRTPDRTRP